MLTGEVLSQWLQQRCGQVLQGSLVAVSTSGLLRVSAQADSHQVRLALPVLYGGQAAVARAELVEAPGPPLALRVQAVSSQVERSRQMERLTSMLVVAQAARRDPSTYPAVLPVAESFVLTVPGSQVAVTNPVGEHELWCDLMAWCPQTLAESAQGWGDAGRVPLLVLQRLAPVFATVRAVHENLNIVHRDITPANVLVDASGRLLLADWGIAHGIQADKTSTHTQLIGNRGFSLPPEMLAGDPSVGRYTDAWYLGSLLVWMLTTQTPGPEHGPGWLPAGMPGGPAGSLLHQVAQGLCCPDPRRRMTLSEAQSRLAQTAAAPADAWVGPPPAPSAVVGTVPAQPPGPTGLTATQQMQGPAPWQTSPSPTASSGRNRLAQVAVAAVAAVALVVAGAVAWKSGLVGAGPRSAASTTSTGGTSGSQAPATEVCWEDASGQCADYDGALVAASVFVVKTGDAEPECEFRYEMRVGYATFDYLTCSWPEDKVGCDEYDFECNQVSVRWFDDFELMDSYFQQVHEYQLSPDTPTFSDGPDGDVYRYEGDDGFAIAYCYAAVPFCLDVWGADAAKTSEIAERFAVADQQTLDEIADYLADHPQDTQRD